MTKTDTKKEAATVDENGAKASALSSLTTSILRNRETAKAEAGASKARALARVVDAAAAAYSAAAPDADKPWVRMSRVSVLTTRTERGDKIEETVTLPSLSVLRALFTGTPVQGSMRLK